MSVRHVSESVRTLVSLLSNDFPAKGIGRPRSEIKRGGERTWNWQRLHVGIPIFVLLHCQARHRHACQLAMKKERGGIWRSGYIIDYMELNG